LGEIAVNKEIEETKKDKENKATNDK